MDSFNKELVLAGVDLPIPENPSKEHVSDQVAKLEKFLYKYPPNSYHHLLVRGYIQELFEKQGGKYDKFVLAFPSKVNTQHAAVLRNNPMLDYANEWRGARVVEFSDTECTGDLFSKTKTFPETCQFFALPRSLAEYNLDWRQLVVCSYITDGTEILLLHTKKGGETRIEDRYTMIQGHVEFNEKAYLMSQYEFLAENALMEFEEEIKTSVPIRFPKFPKYFVASRVNHIDLEHFGIVYEIRVDDVQSLTKQIQSGETNKHDVAVLHLDDLEGHYSKLDAWIKNVVDRLIVDRRNLR